MSHASKLNSEPDDVAAAANAPADGRRRSMVVAAFGTVVEWYDFSIFFYVSAYLATAFYGAYEHSFLFALATGAVGFLFRPLGAMVFGHVGDRIGRRDALVISTSLMALSMFGIALLPTADSIGVWAAVGVVAFRCLAGFSVGAEYTGIMVFLMESARVGRRGLAASWAAANSELGALLAVGLSSWLVATLPADAMQQWGWRVMFAIGGLLAAVMIPLRRLMVETETFARAGTSHEGESVCEKDIQHSSPLLEVLRSYPRAVVLAFLISTVGSVTYFLNITYVPSYLEQFADYDSTQSLLYGTAAATVAIVVSPLFGLASDCWGRRPAFVGLLLAVLVGSVPAYVLLNGATAPQALLGVMLLAVPAAGWSAVAAAAVPEQFTSVGRFSGMAIGYNAAIAIFGGFSPTVAAWLSDVSGDSLAPAYYAVAVCAVAGIPAVVMLRDMARVTQSRVDDPVI